jgi:hypothetical protein
MSQGRSTQTDLERTLIAAEVRCARCGYNLRGLSPLSVCPECGHDIWATVQRVTDPAASRLPKLSNPRAVAWSILWVMLCASLAALLLAFGPVRDELRLAHTGFLATPTDMLALAACAATVAALPGVLILAPPRRKERGRTIWVRIWLLAIGLSAWAACNYGWSTIVTRPHAPTLGALIRLAMYASWVLALLGIDGILKAIGQRSRAYRTARGGRQSAQGMIAASATIALGTVMQTLAQLQYGPATMETYGKVLVWASALMLLIGIVYMLINTLWIFRSLIAPPPPLHSILLRVDDRGLARRD